MRKNDCEHSEYRKNMKKPIDGQYKRITGTSTGLYYCHCFGFERLFSQLQQMNRLYRHPDTIDDSQELDDALGAGGCPPERTTWCGIYNKNKGIPL